MRRKTGRKRGRKVKKGRKEKRERKKERKRERKEGRKEGKKQISRSFKGLKSSQSSPADADFKLLPYSSPLIEPHKNPFKEHQSEKERSTRNTRCSSKVWWWKRT